jgi:hypothetical protein
MKFAIFTGLLIVCLAGEWWLLRDKNLPYTWALVVLLGGGLAQLGMAVPVLRKAFETTKQPETDPSAWQDGSRVRMGGVIKAVGETLKTPFTRQEAVCLEFAARVADEAMGEEDTFFTRRKYLPPGLCGYDQVPFGIVSSRGFLIVDGTPSLKRLNEWSSLDPAYCTAAGALLESARWRLADMRLRDGVYRGFVGQQDKSVRLYLLNTRLAELMLMPKDKPSAGWLEGYPPPQLEGEAAAATLARRMRQRIWQFYEYSLRPGDQVTVEGIYRESPPRIEISNWIRDHRAMEAIRPGLADVTAKAQLRFERTSVLLGVAVTGWLHYAVYANGGALYRSLIGKITGP